MTVKNLEASVQARLQNHARATQRPFQELLQYYAMERFLYRLSKTPHRTRFVLKGALMLHVWDAPLARATKDLDFLGRLDSALENLERVVRDVCAADVDPDGMVFDLAGVKTERIKEDARTTRACACGSSAGSGGHASPCRSKLPNPEACPAKLAEVVTFLTDFLLPIARAQANGETFERRWSPGGPWNLGS